MLSKIYKKGQIVIPAAIRHEYGLDIGDSVEIIPEKGYLKLKKAPKTGLMDLAGIIKSDKPFPDKSEIQKHVEQAIAKRNTQK